MSDVDLAQRFQALAQRFPNIPLALVWGEAEVNASMWSSLAWLFQKDEERFSLMRQAVATTSAELRREELERPAEEGDRILHQMRHAEFVEYAQMKLRPYVERRAYLLRRFPGISNALALVEAHEKDKQVRLTSLKKQRLSFEKTLAMFKEAAALAASFGQLFGADPFAGVARKEMDLPAFSAYLRELLVD